MTNFTATGRIDCEKSILQTYGATQYVVQLIWSGDVPIGRPETYAISCGDSRRLAERLKAAIDGQKAFINPRLVTDRQGVSFVQSDLMVMGRHMERDLTRLGY